MKWIENFLSGSKQAKPTGKSKPRSTSKQRVYAHRYDQMGHRVADLATEQSLGYGQMSGDASTRYDRQQLVSTTRQVYDENIIFSSMLDRVVNNLVGPDGFSFQARTGDERLNELIEKELWPEFTANPEYRDLWDWVELQQGAMADTLGVGDIGFVKLANGQLQAIENERINDPNNSQYEPRGGGSVEQGIQLTAGGKVTGFWVSDSTPGGYGQDHTGRLIPKKNFIYVHAGIQRFSRTRPIPPWIQVMSSIWRMDDILNSEALAWQLLSKHAVAVNKQDADLDAEDLSITDDDSEQYDAPVEDRITEHSGGLFFWAEPGETISGIDRSLPGKDFPASVRAFMQLFAMRVGLPLEILLLDWSKTNFSSGRAALNQATNMIRRYQKAFMRRLHIQVYLWKVRQWIAQGKLPETSGIFNHEWYPPTLPWTDPKEDAEAWGVQIDRGLVTYTDALKRQGLDRNEQNAVRKDDIETAINISKDILENTGVAVPWQYFAGFTVGKTESAFTKKEEDPKEEPEEEPQEEPEENEEEGSSDEND